MKTIKKGVSLADTDCPVATHDLPAEMFPFIIRAFRSDNGELVWYKRVEPPPPLAKMHGCLIEIEVEPLRTPADEAAVH